MKYGLVTTASSELLPINFSIFQIRTLFLYWLPWMLRMNRPGRLIHVEFCSSDSASERKHHIISDVELKERWALIKRINLLSLRFVYRSSKSLLANVLDIDDDFRHNIRPISPSGGTLPHNNAFYRTVYGYVITCFCNFTHSLTYFKIKHIIKIWMALYFKL